MQRHGRKDMGQRLHVFEGSASIESSHEIVPKLRAGFCNYSIWILNRFFSFPNTPRTNSSPTFVFMVCSSRKVWRQLKETPRRNWLDICPCCEMLSNARSLQGGFDFPFSSSELYNTSTIAFAHGLCVGPAVCDISINALVSESVICQHLQ